MHDKPQVLLDTGEVVNISLMVKEDWRDITSHITVQMVGQTSGWSENIIDSTYREYVKFFT